jgi:hypothetical protein
VTAVLVRLWLPKNFSVSEKRHKCKLDDFVMVPTSLMKDNADRVNLGQTYSTVDNQHIGEDGLQADQKSFQMMEHGKTIVGDTLLRTQHKNV